MRNKYQGTQLAFLDMLFNLLLGFAFLFLVSWLMIRPPTQTTANITLKAEIVLTMTWPDGAGDDVDMWLLLPSGEKVFYRRHDVEYVTLDRDDRGIQNDMYFDPVKGQMSVVRMNKEMLTIRALVPGRYVVAGHLYKTNAEFGGIASEVMLPYEAKLVVTKLNPVVSDIATATVMFESQNDKRAFIAFIVREDGSVDQIETNPDDEIIDIDGQ